MPRNLLLFCGALVVTAACGAERDSGTPADADASGRAPAAEQAGGSVHVMLAPTSGHGASGMLMLDDTAGGVRVTGRIAGLPARRDLGFHVHEIGDCTAADASSAGEHFNPTLQPHGDPAGDRHHAGDMRNLDVDGEGAADVDVTLDGLSLDGPADRSLRHRAIVVHAEADDYETQPAGASGDRVACGVIGTDGMSGGADVNPPAGTTPRGQP